MTLILNPKVESQIRNWQEIGLQLNQASEKLDQSTALVKHSYSQMNYWDAVMNRLPSFIGAFLISNSELCYQYNNYLESVKADALEVQSYQVQKNQMIRRIFYNILCQDSHSSIPKSQAALQRLDLLLGEVHHLLALLIKAQNSERHDAGSFNRSAYGSWNDYQSQLDNFAAANAIRSLNQKISECNQNLLSDLKDTGTVVSIQNLNDAADTLTMAEINEGHPVNQMMLAGQYWASQQTLHVLNQIYANTQSIASQIVSMKKQLEKGLQIRAADHIAASYPDCAQAILSL